MMDAQYTSTLSDEEQSRNEVGKQLNDSEAREDSSTASESPKNAEKNKKKRKKSNKGKKNSSSQKKSKKNRHQEVKIVSEVVSDSDSSSSASTPKSRSHHFSPLPNFSPAQTGIDNGNDDDGDANVFRGQHHPLNQPSSSRNLLSPRLLQSHLTPMKNADGLNNVRRKILGDNPDRLMTLGDFRAFENRIFMKINQMTSSVDTMKSSIQNQLPVSLVYPELSGISLPATSIETLELIDQELADREKSTKFARYLAGHGGDSVAQFVGRAMSTIMEDRLCFYTNWTGSSYVEGDDKTPGGTDAKEYTHKTAFSEFKNINATLFIAAKHARNIPDSTKLTADKVEKDIKPWLRYYKERMKKRSHKKKVNAGAPTVRKSPRKRHAPTTPGSVQTSPTQVQAVGEQI